MNRNTADPPSLVNTLFHAMVLNTGAIYEEVSKLTAKHRQFRTKYKSRYSAAIFSQRIMALHRGWRYTWGGFDEDQRHLGYDAV